MKFTISTVKFQEMLSKASRGASCNKQIPLTNLIGIELVSGNLELITTDATNYLIVSETDVQGEDGYVTLELDTLSKLVPKITSETITLELSDKYLNVVGNGSYKLEIPMENDAVVHFPVPSLGEGDTIGDISLSDIKTMLATIRPSLATTYEMPFYMHYYVADTVLGTDTVKASAYKKQVLDGVPRLLNVNLVNLLDVMTDDTIHVIGTDDKIKFVSSNCTVFGTMPSGIEDFNAEAVNGLVSQEFPDMCKVNKADILGALDRIKLFVGVYDDGAITLHFDNDKLTISSKSTTGVEEIAYTSSLPDIKRIDFTCVIEINTLFTQIHAQVSNTINIEFGLPNVLKLVDEDTVSVIALFT